MFNMHNGIKVSIIIPVYNPGPQLDSLLRSLINEKYINQYEIILVDDGSTDNSSKICMKYANGNNFIKYIYKVNGGASSARNIGIQNSKGDFIVFIDADDQVSESFFEILMKTVSTNYDFYIFDYIWKDKDGETPKAVSLQYGEVQKMSLLYKSIVKMGRNAPWGKIYKRAIIDQFGLEFNEHLVVAEDIEFYMQFALKIKTAYVSDKSWYIHIFNMNGLCAQGKITYIYDFNYVYKKICEFIEVTNLPNDILYSVNALFLKNCFRLTLNNIIEAKKKNFHNYDMYQKILNENYKGLKLNVEKLCLKHNLYFLIKIFSCFLTITNLSVCLKGSQRREQNDHTTHS